jgi:Holliday junction resolvasome RuvABC endonuclease subunit
MKVAGIDPGLKGGIVVLDDEGGVVHKYTMPIIENKTTKTVKGKKKTSSKGLLDLVQLDKLIQSLAPEIDHLYIEQVASRPMMSAPSVFKFGRVYGATEALLVSHKIRYTMVTPQKWTKELHAGIEKSLEPKARSMAAFNRLFPHVNLLATERSTKPHDGLVDALLIAEFGRRQMARGEV